MKEINWKDLVITILKLIVSLLGESELAKAIRAILVAILTILNAVPKVQSGLKSAAQDLQY